MANGILTQERLKELLHYEPETGIFTRLKRTSNRIKIGDVAGGLNGGGYIQIRLFGKLQQAHRLAWLYMTGSMPEHEIDHKNSDKSDNCWSNLRDVTHQQNSHNQRSHHSNNKNNVLGVMKNNAGFAARIRINYVPIHLGTFPTKELAHEAYLIAKRAMHSTCTI